MIQTNWNWCSKCQGLFYAGFAGAGVCPAGGGHNRGAGFYTVSYNVPLNQNQTAVIVETGWAFCTACYGLFYGPNLQSSLCPAAPGRPHATSSADYGVIENARWMWGEQRWAWCPKCQGFYYYPNEAQSVCPAGNQHGAPTNVGIFDVALQLTQPLVPTATEWAALVGAFPDLTQSNVLITDQPTPIYNCIAYSLGITSRWINPPNPLSFFQEFYGPFGFTSVAANSEESCIDGWGTSPTAMTHADRLFPVGAAIWESKLGRWYRITHNRADLVGTTYGSVLTSFIVTPQDTTDMASNAPEEPDLLQEEIADVRQRASRVPADLRDRFESALATWRDAASQPPACLSSDSRAYAEGSEHDALAALGPDSVPLVMSHLSDDDGFFLLPLLEQLLGGDPAPKVQPLESEQSRARRAIRAYLRGA